MTPLRPFPDSMFLDAEYAPAVYVNASGDSRPTYAAAGQGVALKACPQPKTTRRMLPDGLVVTESEYRVYLKADPSALNAGKGVREGDAFRFGALTVIAQAPAMAPGAANATWMVPCLSGA